MIDRNEICDRCLEPKLACKCLELDLEEYEAPDVVWVASRPLKPGSEITLEKKHRYAKACQEVERLNRRYAGVFQHFLMPVGRGK
jgi:hypothetical protein